MVKILVVDDSAFMRKVLKNILTKGGYTDLIEATNGEEGVSKFKTDKPALVLLDIIMEKKDGISALKDIIKVNKAANVIMVSAVGQEQMVKEAIASGAKDFIVKPFEAAKVIQSVKKLIK
jgi:two-component system, chemotaxis family, chemotaxis protein CheY